MNGIDFLKSCATNVRTVEDIFQTQYSIYRSREAGAKDDIPRAIADLRQRNVLCAAANDELWVFGSLDPELKQRLETQGNAFSVHEEASIESDPTRQAIDGRTVNDVLLEAIEGCINFSLVAGNALVRIGLFSWCSCESVSEGNLDATGVMVKLHVKFTEDGTLYLSATTHKSPLKPLRNEQTYDGSVVLAPNGLKAKIVSSRIGDEGGSATSGKPAMCSILWKSRVIEAMTTECVQIEPEDEWIVVELTDREVQHRFAWPASMCFAINPPSSTRASPSHSPQHWTHWFGNPAYSHDSFRDPLAVAEEWYIGAAEREKAANAALENFESMPGDTISNNIMVSETPLATSPPFNQRLVEQQAALSGIYPTPPDGLIPNQATQQVTSDGAPSSTQVDEGVLSSELQLGDGYESAPRDHRDSEADAQTYHPNPVDLFGDMEEIDFGTNEVGDADFDYFDEPDELPHPTAHEDVHMGDEVPHVEQDGLEAKDPQDAAADKELDATEEIVAPESSRPTSSHDTAEHDLKHELQESPLVSMQPESAGAGSKEPEKPLSPFGIRERLLPPPIPASALASEVQVGQQRRSSTFEPVTFNENLDLTSKYATVLKTDKGVKKSSVPDISLPAKPRKKRSQHRAEPDSGVTDMETSSEEDSYESTKGSSDDEDMPPRLPWDTKKRKRTSYHDQLTPLTGNSERLWPDQEAQMYSNADFHDAELLHDLDNFVAGKVEFQHASSDIFSSRPFSSDILKTEMERIKPIEALLELTKLDLVYVAQIACEQAISAIPALLFDLDCRNGTEQYSRTADQTAVQSLAEAAIENAVPDIDECSLATLALVREPPPRPMAYPGKASQAGQQRMPPREGSMQLGPDYFNIPPPYLRMQRASDTWEMLPPAMHFWSALGLGPSSGTKDVRAINVAPGNGDLPSSAKTFLQDLGSVYESSKLGSFMVNSDFDDDLSAIENFKDGNLLVRAEEDFLSLAGAFKAYSSACSELGQALAKVGHIDPERTIVICLVDPFENQRATQYLCGCFWQLCKSYRQHIPKANQKSARSDLVLQILPVSIIASADGLVLLDAQQMGKVATEVYDRCPPSSKATAAADLTSTLPILASPAVELAGIPPKRIAFQLASDPPSDLLHEGSILHIAYCLSADGEWVTVCWIDSTGRYQQTNTSCLRGKSFHDVAAEVWERTLEILNSREVTWRVFIVSNMQSERSMQKCWKSLVTSKMRKQVLHVTLLSVQMDPSLQLTQPPPMEATNQAGGQSAGFLTPVTTPQGDSMTVSPDASGTNTNTPAANDNTANNPENDPDAQLIDLTDESWGMLLSQTFSADSSSDRSSYGSSEVGHCGLANGLLFKRGNLLSPNSHGRLKSLGVSLHWDIRIRPGGIVDEGPVRQAEVTLREVLRMYRSLGLLGRLRNLGVADGTNVAGSDPDGIVPVHVVSVMKGAEALNGFLS